MGGGEIMCQECGYINCPPQCPNYKFHKVGTCDRCGDELYEEYEIWTDDDGNKFCSKDCAKDYHGIKEMEY